MSSRKYKNNCLSKEEATKTFFKKDDIFSLVALIAMTADAIMAVSQFDYSHCRLGKQIMCFKHTLNGQREAVVISHGRALQ